MKNSEIAVLFNEIADILELREENRFRVSAYRRGAQNIEGLPGAIEDAAADSALADIPGIGKDLASKINEYLDTGKISFLEELRKETPQVLIDMLRIPGIGPKTAVLLHRHLGIGSLEELRHAALDHRIRELPKMKEKTEENILKGLEFLERSGGRTPIGEAYPLAERIIDELGKLPEVKRITPAGSLRRFRETIGDIDILVTSPKAGTVIERFTHLADVERVLAEGTTKGSVITAGGIQVDLRVVDEKSYGAALCYFTGSKEHNIRLREIAIQKKMKLNEYGLFRTLRSGGERRIAGATEEDVYRGLGLPFIPPEIREDSGEIEAARRGALPALVGMKHIKGDLHFHSNWSDGAASLEELAEYGRKAGYRYLAVSDHSKSLRIAHGLSEDRLRAQIAEIDRINGQTRGFRLLKSSEVDILPDGALDLDSSVLEKLDIVIVAVHSKFKMPRPEMTRRVINAIENPHASILAHPTGRLLGSRDAYEIDMEAVIEAAAATCTAIEINAHPMRLDLNAAMARKAAESGVMISIGTDTHKPALEMRHIRYGVYTARRGWLTKEQILNTRTANQLLGILHKKRNR